MLESGFHVEWQKPEKIRTSFTIPNTIKVPISAITDKTVVRFLNLVAINLGDRTFSVAMYHLIAGNKNIFVFIDEAKDVTGDPGTYGYALNVNWGFKKGPICVDMAGKPTIHVSGTTGDTIVLSAHYQRGEIKPFLPGPNHVPRKMWWE